jgi:CheY-like chemotaxis protein
MRDRLKILLADDDPDDRELTIEAFEQNNLPHKIECVSNGQELMDYLTRSSPGSSKGSQLPHIILLDLNMPVKNGLEALKEIKSNPSLKRIPVIVYTTSDSEEDIVKTYDLGVNSFVTKPKTFDGIVEAIKTLNSFWFELSELPMIA